jgi:hypothetical protein
MSLRSLTLLALVATTLSLTAYRTAVGATDPVTALVEALRQAAPHTDDPALHTDWKMKEGAISHWTKRCVGVPVPATELEGNPVMTRQTVTCVMGPVLRQQMGQVAGDEEAAVRRAAAWWMTGDANQAQAPGIASYLDRVLSHYRALRSAP